MAKIKTTAAVFELPQKLGVVQYVEYERQCTDDGCLYVGILTAEGCRRGICVRYRVWVYSRDRRTWRTKEKWQRGEAGGCLRQEVAEALWELAEKYDVGVWYEYRYRYQFGDVVVEKRDCYLLINGVKLSMPYHCRSVNECIERILEDYKCEVEKLKEPPAVNTHNPAEELLRKYPELEAFGTEWVRKWAPHAKERLIKIAEAVRKYPRVLEAVKKKSPLGNINPYAVEMYVAKDGSEVCILLAPSKAYCVRDGAVVSLDLSCDYDYKEKKMMCRPKGLLAFTAAAREYVKIL
jgi:hypothetical protein